MMQRTRAYTSKRGVLILLNHPHWCHTTYETVKTFILKGSIYCWLWRLDIFFAIFHPQIRLLSSSWLGAEPNQEFLTLTLNPRIAFLCGYLIFRIRVRNSGPKFSTIFMVMVRVRVMLDYDVIIIVCTVLQRGLKIKVAKMSCTNCIKMWHNQVQKRHSCAVKKIVDSTLKITENNIFSDECATLLEASRFSCYFVGHYLNSFFCVTTNNSM